MASRATVASLNEMFAKSPDAPFAVTAKSSARLVVRALNRASQWIKARAGERGMSGTGSTALVLVFDKVTPSQAMVLHAGDSRAYRFRADKLVQLSADHSIAAAAGLRNEKKLPVMFRGVITRAVGLEDTVLLEESGWRRPRVGGSGERGFGFTSGADSSASGTDSAVGAASGAVGRDGGRRCGSAR